VAGRHVAAREATEIGMNRDQLEGRLTQAAGKAKEHWGVLTGAPLVAAAGRRDQLIGRIQERRGNANQEAEAQLRDFMRRNRNWYQLNR
jgi:uncharacterized protein YjbJ (UPF0337 family)